jgi:hypothetical protein
MSKRSGSAWLPRILFRLTFLAATVLLGLVLLGPALDNGEESPGSWRRLLALFARDATVRQTAVASAIGLYVTGGVFFRMPDRSRSITSRQTKPPPPPTHVVGA